MSQASMKVHGRLRLLLFVLSCESCALGNITMQTFAVDGALWACANSALDVYLTARCVPVYLSLSL